MLVVGYGNPMRGDDGIGWHAAAALAEDPRLAGATVLQRRQLTPELAADLAECRLAVFVDARVPEEASVTDIEVVPVAGPPPPGAEPGSWTHHVDARALLALTRRLYGTAPQATLVTAPASSFELSLTEAPPKEDLLREVVETVVAVATAPAGPSPD